MGARMRALDWSHTPLGPVEQWPQSLKTAVQIMLGSRYPMFVWWGRELTNLYNDAYAPMLGCRHPHALGRSAPRVWADVWEVVGPQAAAVLNDGRSTWNEERLLIMERYGYPEETYFTFSYSPVADEAGGVGGVFCAVTEDTTRVLGQRRLRTLRELATATFGAKDAAEACQLAAGALGANPYDLPFVLLYLFDTGGACARLAGMAGVEAKAPGAPPVIDLRQEADGPWPLRRVLQSGAPVCLEDLERQVGVMPGGPWPAPPSQALVWPLAQAGQAQLAGVFIAGVSPFRPLDEEYRGFCSLVANSVATAIADARAHEAERQRAEALAELDRAKTTFFSNVSHEFRTPLTLMLGPLEDLLTQPAGTPGPEARAQLEVIHRNGLRLLKLVNVLLDFARLQAGRIEASYEPTDLATVTADLASVFRSAIERAGLRLQVECPPLPEAVYVDRDMWEKIVLNLLSNALKFTFEGEITVRLHWGGTHVELTVHDTGTGIPAHELPHLFERFYRIRDARARTHEGAGIGLALVQELVQLHGGQITVTSEVGIGTTFTVTIPTGTAHLPADRVGAARRLTSTALEANAFVEETRRWLPAERQQGEAVAAPASLPATPPGISALSSPRLLVADDNADMRAYLQRLLSPHWQVETVADGEQALAAARVRPPDLVLADVMMPGLDGLALLRALRADPRTAPVPVILLSARAGEEARVEGLAAGADDYLVKPFVARELLARVETHLKLARLRDDMQATIREREERLRLALDVAALGAWVWDLDSDRITWDGYHEQLFGFEPDGVAGTSEAFYACVHPDDRASLMQAATRALVGDAPFYSAAFRIVRPDGVVRWMHGKGKLVRDAAGQPMRMLGTVQDITERLQAEEALRAAQEQLRLITDNVPAFIAYLDHDERYRFVNAAYERHRGLPRAQVLGRTVRELRGPIYEYLRPYLARALAGEAVTFENLYAFDAGAPALQVSYVPDRQPDGQVAGVYVLITDITAQKQAQAELVRLNRALELREAALRESEEQLRAIYAHAPVGISQTSLAGQLMRVNPRFCEITGYSEAELLGSQFQTITHPEDLPTNLDLYRRLQAGEFPSYHMEKRYIRKGGQIVWTDLTGALVRDVEGRPQYGVAVIQDITARKEAEVRLRESEAQFRLLADLIPGVVWTAPPDGPADYANRYWYAYTGYPVDQSASEIFFQAIHPQDAARATTAWAEARCTGEPYETELRLRDGHGTYRWFLVRSVPVRDADGTIRKWVGLSTDITSLKEAEAVLEQHVQERTAALEQAMAEQQRLEREAQRAAHFTLLGRLAAGVAHEIRNPLGAVVLHVDILEEELRDPSPTDPEIVPEALTAIKTNLARVDDLVQDYLSLVRVSTIQRQVQDLGAAVQAWCREFQGIVAALGVTLQAEGVEALGPVALHASTLRRALFNLVQNAAEAMPQGGTVTLVGQSTADQVQLQVRDTGHGIPAEHLVQIFEPLHTTKPEGTGLGLYIVQEILAAHGGQVTVQSVVGQGTTFTLTLPRAVAAPSSQEVCTAQM
jgi:PAS domain S-box-containing protein